ncbi:helix-turn-helix domain-containing protein [Nocardioides sp. CPCC 205120]|uniref:helix-turn-helix domain-containing protein n=1 Tax=Nocardioides sp. CPCC 205120 TaxID=3406462 RepID=UPI003B50672A
MTSWLGLLADDGSAEALRAHRSALLADAGEDERARIEAEAEEAEVLRRLLAERRQAARELAVLNDLARRLAHLRDTSEVLQEVAAQARRLLGVDVAYIMLRFEETDLRIEVADGSMGSALRGVVLRDGEGIGGMVLRGGSPMWTEAYLEDDRLRRVSTADAVAVSEQLGGILGVPLRVGEDTIGVLLAADRRPRRFSEHEVELLAGLASHAAIALRNAALFEQVQAAVEEQRVVNDALRRTSAERQRATDLRADLTDVVIRGGGLVEVAAAIGRAVGVDVRVLVADGRVADAAGERPGPDAEVAAVVGAVPDAAWFAGGGGRTRRAEADGRHLALTPVTLRDGYAGCVVAAGASPVDEQQVRLLEIGATSVALVVSSERTVAEAELRTRGELVSALLAPDADDASIRRRARAAGIALDAVTAVVVLDAGVRDHGPAVRLATRLAAATGGWSAEHAGHAVVLVPRIGPAEARTRLLALVEDAPPAAVGVAPCGGGGAAIRAAHEEARQTATLLLALGRESAVAQPAELGVYRSLFSRAGRGEIGAFVEATVGPVLRHDAERGRDLTGTLEAFLRLAQHHARTCAELHVHANTLYQRLDRLAEVLGPDWRDPERVLEIQLALKLRRLMDDVPLA